MNDNVRVAIIGCGGIARSHAKAYAASGDICQLVASADTSVAAADAFGKEFGGAVYHDGAQMLDEVRPQAVSICTPPSSHLPLVRLCAQRGIAVLCEKPLARTLAEADELVDVVEQSGILFMHGLCHRFHGPVSQMMELVRNGSLGKIIHYYNRFSFRFEGVENRWFSDPEIAGGGILLDTAVHSLDLFSYIVGSVAEISAHVSTTLPIRVEDSAAILVASESGVSGDISCSWVTTPGESIVRLYCTGGIAELDYNGKPNLRYCLGENEAVVPVLFEGPDRFAAEIRHFVECVRSNSRPAISVYDGRETIRLIEEAYASAEVPRPGVS